jgi:hypothetical protein
MNSSLVNKEIPDREQVNGVDIQTFVESPQNKKSIESECTDILFSKNLETIF